MSSLVKSVLVSPDKWRRRVGQAWPRHAYAKGLVQPLWQNSVFYESYEGRGALCHPEAIFRELIAASDMQHLEHIWVLTENYRESAFYHEFKSDKRVRFVDRKTPGYFKALARAKFVFNNQTFPSEFVARKDQIVVNTWHGTPLKKMGFDRPAGAFEVRNVIRNFVQSTYLLSPNRYTTEQMYERAYRLKGYYSGTILEVGSPRIDRQLRADAPKETRLRLERLGVDVGRGKKVALYAPTWKGRVFADATINTEDLEAFFSELQERLGSEWHVLLKVHQSVYDAFRDSTSVANRLIPNEMPTNDVLSITDALIGDYSSIFFDFLAQKKPVYFYVPDFEAYGKDLGTYLEFDELPGPLSYSVEQLAGQMLEDHKGGNSPWLDSKYMAAHEAYVGLEDGNASRRLVDIVFRKRAAQDVAREANQEKQPGAGGRYRALNVLETDKTRLLFFLGGMQRNGITMSALNLIKAIDPKKFDVTVLYRGSSNVQRQEVVAELPDTARPVAYAGVYLATIPATVLEYLRLRRAFSPRRESVKLSKFVTRKAATDWRRIFSNIPFDHVIDFSGYSGYWPTFLMQAKKAKRSIWMHNDLASEHQMYKDNPGLKGKRELHLAFSLYKYFDNLVSVSDALREVNEKNLNRFAENARFYAIPNLSNGKQILESLEYSERPIELGAALQNSGKLSSVVEELGRRSGRNRLLNEAKWQLALYGEASHADRPFTFVSMGRMSQEKNHRRLIEAFNIVHKEEPNTRLVLVGEGPLQHQLRRFVDSMGLTESVHFAGFVSPPYPLVSRADCFVLSSDHEGQPMVLLEARTLGLPIVTTAFSSVYGAVDDECAVIVERSSQDLARGMLQATHGDVPQQTFDWEAYNEASVQRFYEMVR